MSTNKDNSGTYVGFFEGIHKAFKIIDKSFDFNARCIVLSIYAGNNPTGLSTACYFTKEQNINNPSIIPTPIQTLEEVYIYIHNNLIPGLQPLPYNIPLSPPKITDFFSKTSSLLNTHKQRCYLLKIGNDSATNREFYALMIFREHEGLPHSKNPINVQTLQNFRDILENNEGTQNNLLLLSLFLISVLEIKDKFIQFIRYTSTPTLMSAFTHLTEKELLTRAASSVLNFLVTRNITNSNNVTKPNMELNYLYSNLDTISRTRYEKRETTGVLLVQLNKSNSSVLFRDPIPLNTHKAARKIIEMAGTERFIESDGICLYGIGITPESFPVNSIQIYFQGFDQWEARYNGNSLFKVKNSIPYIQQPVLTLSEFERKIQSIFNSGELAASSVKPIYKIIELAINTTSHGALIVISNKANAEAQRLGRQAIQLKSPTHLQGKILEGIFSIDGAILLDTTGMCHAIGVILDGLAANSQQLDSSNIQENAARGSRFNSSVRYVNSQRNNNTRVTAIVISEDGQVDVL